MKDMGNAVITYFAPFATYTKVKYILNQNLMVLCRWILCQTNEYWSTTKIKSALK
jgi:hypothetical protein